MGLRRQKGFTEALACAGVTLSGSCSELCWVLFQEDQMSPMRQMDKVPENIAQHPGQQVDGAWYAAQAGTVSLSVNSGSALSQGQPHWAETLVALLPWLPAKTVYCSKFRLMQLKDPQNKKRKRRHQAKQRLKECRLGEVRHTPRPP